MGKRKRGRKDKRDGKRKGSIRRRRKKGKKEYRAE